MSICGDKGGAIGYTRRMQPSNPGPAGVDAGTMSPETQRALFAKIAWRLIPLLFVGYVIAYVDRINVGFAKLHLQPVLGLADGDFAAAFGFGAGLFFIGYFIFEVPSNFALHKIGARIWIARIMIVWGFVSMAFMFLNGKTMFYIMRFLLGAAEAGFFPGVILYLTYWFPARERAKTIALFAIGGVTAGVIGSPLSGALLELDGMGGLKGWQWLFLLEGLPAVLMGIYVLKVLPNGPAEVSWLSDSEKAWLKAKLDSEATEENPARQHSFRAVLSSGFIWLLCLLYFLMNVGSYGYEMWLPTIVKKLSGQSDWIVGAINAIPYALAGLAMFLVGRHSDKTNERRWHVSLSAAAATIGFVVAAKATNPYLALAALVVAFAGLKCTIAPFWALTTASLTGTAAAGGIALINSVGNLGGFVGPYAVGLFKAKMGNDVAALLLLGGCLFAMAVLTLQLPKTPNSRSPAPR